MKSLTIILIYFAISCSFASGLEAITSKGKKVILKEDGTWEYAKETTSKVTQGLGLRDEQVLANLEEYFSNVEVTTPVKGQPRRMGETDLASIEIIGNPKDVQSVTVLIGIPNDSPEIIVRNAAICLILIHNTLPNWSEGAEWFNMAIEKIGSSSSTSEEIVIGNKTVKLSAIKEMGIFYLTISSR